VKQSSVLSTELGEALHQDWHLFFPTLLPATGEHV